MWDDCALLTKNYWDSQKRVISANIGTANDIFCDDRLVHKFPCREKNCNKAYIHRKDVIRHMRIRHGITPQKLEAIIVETPEKPHICGINCCRRSYFHMKDLKRHQRLCHQVNVTPVTPAEEDTSIDSCGVIKTQFRFPCDFKGCLRSYIHKKDLVRHKRLYHKDVSNKPSIPMPIRYTDIELKQIRQKVRQEIDTRERKMRLDSISSSSESTETLCLDHVDIGNDTDCCTILLTSSTLNDVNSNATLNSSISNEVASILGALEQHSPQFFETAIEH